MSYTAPKVPTIEDLGKLPKGFVYWVSPEWRYDAVRTKLRKAAKSGLFKKSHWKKHPSTPYGDVFVRTSNELSANTVTPSNS